MDPGSVRPILGFCVAKITREEPGSLATQSASPCTPRSPLTEALRASRSFNLPTLKIRHRRSFSEGSEVSQITPSDDCEREGIPIPDSRMSTQSVNNSLASSAGFFIVTTGEANRHNDEPFQEDDEMEDDSADLTEQDVFEMEVPAASLIAIKALKQIKTKLKTAGK